MPHGGAGHVGVHAEAAGLRGMLSAAREDAGASGIGLRGGVVMAVTPCHEFAVWRDPSLRMQADASQASRSSPPKCQGRLGVSPWRVPRGRVHTLIGTSARAEESVPTWHAAKTPPRTSCVRLRITLRRQIRVHDTPVFVESVSRDLTLRLCQPAETGRRKEPLCDPTQLHTWPSV